MNGTARSLLKGPSSTCWSWNWRLTWRRQRLFLYSVEFPDDDVAAYFLTKSLPPLGWKFVRKCQSTGPFDRFERDFKLSQTF